MPCDIAEAVVPTAVGEAAAASVALLSMLAAATGEKVLAGTFIPE